MSYVDATPKDLMKGVNYPTGWYTVRIDTVSEKTPAKSGESNNIHVEGTIVKNSDTGDLKYAGYPTPPNWLFNDSPKAVGFALGFLRAFGIDPAEGRNTLKQVEGKTVDVMIVDNEYNGRISSKVDHSYRPAR